MIQTVVIALPAFAALIVCLLRGPKQALLDVYLPTLLLLPHSFNWPIWYKLPFSDPVIVVIAFFLLFQRQQEWRWSSIDFLIVAYLAITVASTCINFGFKFGQQLTLKEVCSIFLPYYAAKQTMGCEQFAIEAAKRIAGLLAVVAVISVYELRMGNDLFLWPFRGVFPLPDTVMFRSGFMRTQGPFGHAMAQGVMMAVVFPIACWLDWKGIWHDRLPFLPISKIRFCELWILAGLMMTISYGDWIGAAAGIFVLLIYGARNHKLVLALMIFCAVVLGLPIYLKFKAYVSVDMRMATDRTQQDAAYRNHLLQVYIPVIEERPTWGWGQFPVIDGMFSIDNGYLYIALLYGLYALGLWVAVLLWSPIRLCALGVRLARGHPGAPTAFALAAVYVVVAICSTEGAVMAGPQSTRFFFLVTGWSVALLESNKVGMTEAQVLTSPPRTRFAFRRVMA
jgi:O-Antigen ligase